MVGAPGLALQLLGQAHLVAGADGDLLLLRHAAAGHVQEVQAARLQARARRPRLCSRSQPPSTQSVADRRTPTGMAAGTAARTASKTCSGRRMRFSSEPPYASAARIGDRRQELVQQVAVRRMQLDRVQPQPVRAPRSIGEGRDDALHAGLVERLRRRLALGMRQRRRRQRPPATRLIGRNQHAALPGHMARRLAPGMAELDGDGHGRMRAHRAQHTRERGFGGVGPQPQASLA